jgi:hypothetical protein
LKIKATIRVLLYPNSNLILFILPNFRPANERRDTMNDLPIDLEFLQKRKMIPVKIAELSYKDEEAAIKFMRIWGEKKMAISVLFEELTTALSQTN